MRRPSPRTAALVLPAAEVVRHAVLYAALGLAADKDLIDAAWVIPDLMLVVLAGGSLAAALGPSLDDVFGHDRETARTVTAALRVTATAVVVVAAVVIALSPSIAAAVFPSITESARLAGLLRIGAAAALLVALGSMVTAAAGPGTSGWLGLTPAVQVAATTAGGVLGGFDRAEDFAWGSLAGAGIGFLLAAFAAHRAGIAFEWTTPWRHRALPGRWRVARSGMAGSLLFSTASVWLRLAAQFTGVGSLAAVAGVHALLAGAASATTAGVPTPSVAADNAWLRVGTAASVRVTIARSALVAALTIGLAHPIAAGIYGWGRMTASDIATLATFLSIGAIAIPFVSLMPIYRAAMSAEGAAGSSHTVGAAALGLGVATGWLASRSIGTSGLLLGWVAWSMTITVGLATRWHEASERALLGDVAKAGLAATVAGLAAGMVAAVLAGSHALVVLPVGAVAGVTVWNLLGRLAAGLERRS